MAIKVSTKKSLIRVEILKQRRSLSKQEADLRSNKVASIVISKLFLQIKNLQKKKIAIYLSANGEVGTENIINYIFQTLKNHNILLPRIDLEKNEIVFKLYDPTTKLKQNSKYKNILEPHLESAEIEPEIIFIPLVACDKFGNRIGMGGGFYDKKIAKLKQNNPSITVIGLAYNFQLIDKIEVEKHDQTIDFIVLEDEMIDCKFLKQS